MSVLSMLAFRMVTQEGLAKCLRIHRALRKSDGCADERVATPDTQDAKSPSRSAKRRIRRRKLRESRRREDSTKRGKAEKEEGETAEEEIEVEKGAKEKDEEQEAAAVTSRENRSEDGSVDVEPYNLVTHRDRRTGKDFLERSLMAAFLLKCLQRVGFFARPTADDGTYYRALSPSPADGGLCLTSRCSSPDEQSRVADRRGGDKRRGLRGGGEERMCSLRGLSYVQRRFARVIRESAVDDYPGTASSSPRGRQVPAEEAARVLRNCY